MSESANRDIETQVPSWLSLTLCLLLTYLPALMGIRFGPDAWYRSLERPIGNPPNWVFGPVWTTLYLMMGVAVWLVWSSGPWRSVRAAIALFTFQLVVNTGWSWLFFGQHAIGWALVDLLVLVVLVMATIVIFRRHSSTAAALLFPYVAWLVFAGYLNGAYWLLNRGSGG